jgi:hypothetical protein
VYRGSHTSPQKGVQVGDYTLYAGREKAGSGRQVSGNLETFGQRLIEQHKIKKKKNIPNTFSGPTYRLFPQDEYKHLLLHVIEEYQGEEGEPITSRV